MPDGELGVIVERGRRADHDPVKESSHPVRVMLVGGVPDPLGLSVLTGDPPVEGLGDVACDEALSGAPGARRADQDREVDARGSGQLRFQSGPGWDVEHGEAVRVAAVDGGAVVCFVEGAWRNLHEQRVDAAARHRLGERLADPRSSPHELNRVHVGLEEAPGLQEGRPRHALREVAVHSVGRGRCAAEGAHKSSPSRC